MDDDAGFSDLISKVRARDDKAAAELFQRYEPELKRIVRIRLTSPQLRRVLDSGDICQSVFCNLYLRLASGQFELSSPGELLRLLASMALNRVNDKARHHLAQKRGSGQAQAWLPEHLAQLHSPTGGPEREASFRDLYQQTLSLLDEDERQLAVLRGQGMEWQEIAVERGEQPDALRKRLGRALDRVAKQLDLDELHDA